MIYVSGLRGSYNREFYLHGIPSGNVFPGDFEDYVPSILGDWQESSPDRVYGLYELSKLRRWLRDLELASSVEVRKLSESQLEVRIPRTFNGDSADLVNIADVGLAVSQVLPVLVALIVAHPNQLVYIEQPELHLQTRAQVKLAQLLAEASNRGVRVVIETHSSLLLRGILTEVAKGAISKDKVMLHWFERDKATGISTVTSQEPDAAGRVGDWPEDFSDVELSSDNDYLSAVEGNLLAAKK
jgi:predicted ATPase